MLQMKIREFSVNNKNELHPKENFCAVVFGEQQSYGYNIHYIGFDPEQYPITEVIKPLCLFRIKQKSIS